MDTVPNAPRYWMHETSGDLRTAVEAYLHDEPMTDAQVAVMRAYLEVGDLTSRAAISAWLNRAERLGIDPL